MARRPSPARQPFIRSRSLLHLLAFHPQKPRVFLCTVLDWLVQPKPRWLGGNGWLLEGPEEVLQGRRVSERNSERLLGGARGGTRWGLNALFLSTAEACSTTEDGDEPLRCPTGYECHIINPGNAAEGIPNRGQCIKLRGNSGTSTGMPVRAADTSPKHLSFSVSCGRRDSGSFPSPVKEQLERGVVS